MTMHTVWTPARIDGIQKLWASGKSLSEIALAFGVTRSVISGVMARNRDIFPIQREITLSGNTKWTDDKLERLKKLYLDGVDYPTIAEDFRTTVPIVKAAVTRFRGRLGLPKRERKPHIRTSNSLQRRAESIDDELSISGYNRVQKNSPYSRVRETASTNRGEDTTYERVRSSRHKTDSVKYMPKAIPIYELPDYYQRKVTGPVEGYGMELLFLDSNSCRAPIAEDNETVGRFRFCGKVREPISSYCTACARRLNPPR